MNSVTLNLILFTFITIAIQPIVGNAQNVGIGTTAPTAKLDVSSASTFISRFNSNTNQGFITVAENNIPRAYFGSYAGATEDVDLGTTASNLPGKLHLTIQSNPKLTIDNSGNVGIGTMVPSERLEVSGNLKMNGEIKPQGIAGTSGQVLTSNGNGTMQWATPVAGNGTGAGNGGWGDCSIQNIDSYQPAVNPGSANGDSFGNAVSISGNYAIVGSFFDMENGMANAGSASFYQYDPLTNNWQHLSKVLDATPGTSEHFGYSVSISGDYAVVGNAKDTELGITRCGSATVFKRNSVSNNWENQGKLFNLNPAQDDNFGYSVSISGDYIIVGANYDDENAIVNTGSAVIFKRNTSTNIWENQGKIVNPACANSDFFGSAVSIFGDFAIVGSPNDNENGVLCGSATIFKWNNNNNTWESQGKITGQTPTSNEQFGTSVFLNGNYLAISTLYEYQNNLYNGSITLYVKNQNTNTWEFSKVKNGPSSTSGDRFGGSVSVSDNYLIVGADNRTVNGYLNAGSVTIYKRYENNWIEHESFSCPVSEAYTRFGTTVSLDPVSQRFIIGAPGFENSTGLVNFGKIK